MTTPSQANTTAPAAKSRRPGSGGIGGKIIIGIGIALIVVYCLAPFYWMLVTSLRDPARGLETTLWPSKLSLDNYVAVFDPRNNFLRAVLNSLIVSVTTTVLAVLIGTAAAYAIARLKFKGKTVMMFLIVSTSMFPIITLVVPLLQLFQPDYLDWINTYQAMIVPSVSFALPLAVWNLNAFFRQLPRELEQAAMVDGCTPIQAFIKIILPLAAPGVFTTAIITFIAAWNEFLIAVTMVNRPELRTVTAAIGTFTGDSRFQTPYGTIMAAGVLVTVPLVIMVLIFQRRIVQGLAAGSLK